MITVDRLKEEDFSYFGSSYKNNSLNGFIFRTKNESADILRDKYDIHREHIHINWMYENYSQFIEIEGYSDPMQSDAINARILLEDENIIKELLNKTLRK